MKHLLIILHGIVQNVGFRYHLKLFADKNRILGFVRNRPDKTVEIYFIGDEKALNKLTSYIYSNPGYSKVGKIEILSVNEKKKFDSFEILY